LNDGVRNADKSNMNNEALYSISFFGNFS
jgi:hypothetical protein